MATSRATLVLNLLKDNANKKGYVKDLDSDKIKKILGWNIHDTNKTIFDLQHRGLVGFSQNNKQGRDGTILLYRFRLTKHGMSIMNVPENEVSETEGEIPIDEETKEIAGRVPTAVVPLVETATKAVAATPPPPLPQHAPRYPHLLSLIDRKRLAEEAAKNLEALGADNLALQALALVDTPLTPLQKEIAQFFVDYPEFVKFVVEK